MHRHASIWPDIGTLLQTSIVQLPISLQHDKSLSLAGPAAYHAQAVKEWTTCIAGVRCSRKLSVAAQP